MKQRTTNQGRLINSPDESPKALEGPDFLDSLVSTYVARRELLPIIVDRLLANTGLTIEEADVLLEIFGSWKLGWKVPTSDPEGYVTQKALESSLMNSQPNISKKVGRLERSGYLHTKRLARTGALSKANKVSLTKEGEEKILGIWGNYNRLASRILQGVDEDKRLLHYSVCQKVCARIRPHDFLEEAPGESMSKPVDNLMAIFEMARDVRNRIEEVVLPGTGVSLERADLLVILFLSQVVFRKIHLPGEMPGFVSFAAIRDSLVHSISPSKSLLSQWTDDLSESGLIEVHKIDERRKAAGLTQKGVDITTPIWENYAKLAADLMKDISAEERQAHIIVNSTVVGALQAFGKKDVLTTAKQSND